MKVNYTGGISLLGSRTFWSLVVTLGLMLGGVFGSKPDKDVSYVVNADGSYRSVAPQDVSTLPEGTILVDGVKAEELKKSVWTEKLFSAGSLLAGLLTAYFAKKDPNISTFLPPGSGGRRLPSVLWGAGLLTMAVAGSCVGCGSAQRAEYAAYRDADFQGTSVMRAEHLEWSRIIAGDKNMDGRITADEGGAIDLTKQLPNLNALTYVERDAWLRLREAEQEQSRLRYENSKVLDEKAAQGTGPFGFFGTLFGPRQ